MGGVCSPLLRCTAISTQESGRGRTHFDTEGHRSSTRQRGSALVLHSTVSPLEAANFHTRLPEFCHEAPEKFCG